MSFASFPLLAARKANAIFAALADPTAGPILLDGPSTRRGNTADAHAAIAVNPWIDDGMRIGIDVQTGEPFFFEEPDLQTS